MFLPKFKGSHLMWYRLPICSIWLLHDLQQCDWNNRIRTLSIHCTVQRYFNLDFYIQLPDNVSLLNELMCGPLNREDKLCRKCKDGYGIAIYSCTQECRKCWGHGYGWVLYYSLELFPVTVLYFWWWDPHKSPLILALLCLWVWLLCTQYVWMYHCTCTLKTVMDFHLCHFAWADQRQLYHLEATSPTWSALTPILHAQHIIPIFLGYKLAKISGLTQCLCAQFSSPSR